MNRNRMLVLAVVALILSGAVTYLAYRLLQSRLKPVDDITQVVVATEKLPLGTRLTEKQVKLSPWPKATPIQGSFSDPAQVLGRGLLVDVYPNEPIMESKLAPKEAGAGLAIAIPEGMRALSIQVNSIIGVAGFVQPGSRVDLILTTNPPDSVKNDIKGKGKGWTGKGKGWRGNVKGSPEDDVGTKIVLENLQVLAIGQNVQRDVEGKPMTVQEVTLLVTPEQASKIALATGEGRIQLALRNPLDKETVDPPLVFRSALYEGSELEAGGKLKVSETESEKTAAELGSGPKRKAAAVKVVKAPPPPPPAPAPPAVAPAPHVVTVELIQGAKRASESFEEKKAQEEKKVPDEKKP